ncbi:MAG: amidase [Candidatus Solibacter usitatus]|nr:amidase [Candidatus Solibacter usitatus]
MKAAISDDLFFATLGELNAKLRAREISAVELTRAFAQRLETLGPRYNALALPLTKQAVRAAQAVDKEFKRERFRGPLQGIPFGAKDLLAYRGHPTTWGAKPYAEQVFDYDATALVKLEKAGALLIGKLSMVELAGGGGYRFPAASLFGPGLNPWDRTRWSGGSSSGSGSAVAAGLVPFALGSETNGSILSPSASCGVTGLRPTYGLVSRHGAMALAWSLDKIGPMCRSAEDCAFVLQAMSGADSKDPASAGKSFYYTPQFYKPVKQLRIGYSPSDFSEWAQPAARPAFEKALAVIRETGAKLVETQLPDFPYSTLTGTIINAEMASIFEPLIASGKVDELADKKQIAGLKASLELPAKDYLKAMRLRTLVQHAMRKLFIDIDVLLAPSRPGPATKLDEALDRNPPPALKGLNNLTSAGNLAGLPALSLPCGFADQLPVALQVVGRPFSENMLIMVGKEFQSRTDWHRQRPPAA